MDLCGLYLRTGDRCLLPGSPPNPLLAHCQLTAGNFNLFGDRFPTTWSNNLVVPPLAFGMAMLNLAFDKIEGLGYNNVFSTGNLKKAVTGWCAYFLEGDRQGLTAAVNYTGLVSAFILGALLSAVLQRVWGTTTIWGASVLLTIVSGLYAFLLYRRSQYTKSPFYRSGQDDGHLD